KYKNYLALHAIVFIWGFTGILGKLISISSTSIVWWRMFIASLGILLFVVITKRKLKTTPIKGLKYVLTGMVTALHWIFFFESIKVSNVSIGLTALASTSLFVALLEPLFFKRRILPYEVLMGGFTIIGLGIIFQAETTYSLGITFGIISAVLAAVFSTLNGTFVKNDKPTLITTYEMIGGLFGLTIYFGVTDGFQSFVVPAGIDWVWLLILGLVCTSMAYVISIEVLKELSPFTASMSINLEPIYSIIFALIIFKDDEYMSPLFYIGAIIVIGNIFLNGIIKRKTTAKAIPAEKA
ncbi:MAG: DMT family transporter, partial [Salibacteraceae bacterium]|nr:DMT family transporter [Salibacteraceae bacterium]